MPLETIDEMTGKFWKLFGPGVAVAWLGVTPSSPRSIPRSPLPKIWFERIELPVVVTPTTSTPLLMLKAIVLPAPLAVPPIVLFDAPWSISTPSIALPEVGCPLDIAADEVPLDQVARGSAASEVQAASCSRR